MTARDDLHSTTAAAAAATASHKSDAPLSYNALFQSLARHARVFPLRSERVALLPSPTAFYDQLLTNVRSATQRITISSLYLGTGPRERALVDAIATTLRARPGVRVTIVLDYSRGQRGGQDNSSVTMLKRLLAEFPHSVELFLYKVPQLQGVRAKLPPPFNETLGVSHAKVYLVDNTLILSGANLSDDYFTNRQDRYVQMTDCGGLAEFYHAFVRVVAAHAFHVTLRPSASSDSTDCAEARPYELYRASSDAPTDLAAMKHAFETLVTVDNVENVENVENVDTVDNAKIDTYAFPTIQFSPIDVTHDEHMLTTFLEQLPPQSTLRIASGYLNFPPFVDELLVNCRAHVDVLLAAPSANGFFTARGVKGALPMAYSLIEHAFYDRIQHAPHRTDVTSVLREFNRPHWTFHGKGMWWSPTRDALPHLTIFGSSNFGRRSYGLDLESQVVLVTKDAGLQRRLANEYDALTQHAEVVTDHVWTRPDRMLRGLFSWKAGHWIRPVAKLISAYL